MMTSLPANVIDTKYSTPILLALIAAGLAGNYFHCPVFLNTDFVFGSIFAMVALQFFGSGRAILVAAIIACYTYFLWHHPYSIIVMTAEVAVVGYLFERRKMGIVMADMLYWLIIGIPLAFFFQYMVMHSSISNVSIILAKQAINGIVNTLVARLIYTGLARWLQAPQVTFRDLTYNLLAFFVLFPSLLILIVESRSDFNEIERNIRTTLQHESERVDLRLETWVLNRKFALLHLADMAVSRSPEQMQPSLEQAQKSDINMQRISLMDKEAATIASYPLLDDLGQSNIGKKHLDRLYFPLIKESRKPMLSEIFLSKMGALVPEVAVLAPVTIRGEFGGYVGGILSLAQIQEYLDKSSKHIARLYTLLDKNGNVIMTNRTDQTVMTPFGRGEGKVNRLDDAISQWVPNFTPDVTISESWIQSLYFTETAIGEPGEWKLLLEQPLAPFLEILNESYARKLILLFLVLFVALLLAELISRRFIRTLEKLSEMTQDLPSRLLTNRNQISWPETGIIESNNLINNFREMTYSLTTQFNEVRQINETLEQRVEERTMKLQESQSFNFAILNSISAAIAVLDNDGVIIAVNNSWKQFALKNSIEHDWPEQATEVGSNYLGISRMYGSHASDAREGICSVLDGRLTRFSLEYPCHSPEAERWFIMNVTPLDSDNRRGVVIVHNDITAINKIERDLVETTENYHRVFENQAIAICIIDPDTFQLLDFNNTFTQIYGYTQEDLRGGMSIIDLSAEPEKSRVSVTLEKFSKSFSTPLRYHKKKNGTIFPVEIFGETYLRNGRIVMLLMMVDITERKRSEEQLLRLNRMLTALTHSNAAMLHAVNEMAYVQEVCDIIVKDCGHPMAWIGFAENDANKTVRPVANAGIDAGYFETLRITWADTHIDIDTTGTAIRTGQVQKSQAKPTEHDFSLLFEDSLEAGYHSTIALPLITEERCLGAITIYDSQPDRFSENEVLLLTELADNLAFGISGLRLREEHARAAEALHKSRTLLDTSQQLAKIGGWDYDLVNGRITWTDELYRIFGLSPVTFNPNNFWKSKKFFHPEDWQLFKKNYKELVKKGTPYKMKLGLIPANGQQIWAHFIGQPELQNGQLIRVFGSVVDITELHEAQKAVVEMNQNLETRVMRRTAALESANKELQREISFRQSTEKCLKESEKRFRTLFEASNNAILIIKDTVIIDCNNKTLEMLRCSFQEIIGISTSELPTNHLPGGQSFEWEKIFPEVAGLHRQFEGFQSRFDKTLFYAEINASTVDISGKKYLQVIIRDITMRKNSEKALKNSEFRFRSFYNTNPVGIILLDFQGIILDANKEFLKVSGYTLTEITQKNIKEFIPETYRTDTTKALLSIKAGGTQIELPELFYVAKNGETIPVSARGWIVKDEEGAPLYMGIFIHDLTKEKALAVEKAALEKQVMHAQKSEAIGTLAGGIAHDFNNILGGIIGFTQLALFNNPSTLSSKERGYIERVLEGGHRATDLVQQILRFSRPGALEMAPISLTAVVKESINLLRATLPKSIEIKEDLHTDDDSVFANFTQMHQVVMNLCTNAYHAMRETGGLLKISLKKEFIAEPKEFMSMRIPPGDYLKMSVADTGMGMSSEVCQRIFEPYYTTKKMNEGTGLGMTVTKGIIKSHKGLILIETILGKGTCFDVFLPLAKIDSTEKKNIDGALPLGQGERVLIVDDEAFFLEVVEESLTLLGYQVSASQSSLKTLETFMADPERYDLLITDQSMPDMTGVQLATEVRKISSTLPIILCTGYSEIISEQSAGHYGITSFLMKPVNIEDLAKTVHEIFAGRRVVENG